MKTINKKNIISIYPDDRLLKLIKDRSKKEKRSMSNCVLYILDDYFK